MSFYNKIIHVAALRISDLIKFRENPKLHIKPDQTRAGHGTAMTPILGATAGPGVEDAGDSIW
jgi:hypothetical protein